VVEFDVLVRALGSVSSKEKRLFRKHDDTAVLREDFLVHKAVSDCVTLTLTSIPPSNSVDVGLVENRALLW